LPGEKSGGGEEKKGEGDINSLRIYSSPPLIFFLLIYLLDFLSLGWE